MEYFDVFDKNRVFLNYSKIRGDILKHNEYNQGAEIWIINNKKILLTKRSINKSHPGMWEVPGGCCKKGETTLNTIVREIKEEIGLAISKEDIIYLNTKLYKKQFVDIFKTNFNIDTKNIKLQLDEVEDARFVSKIELYKMMEKNMIVPSVIERFKMVKDELDID